MRMKTFLRCGGSLLLASSLAACGGGDGGGSTPTPTPAPAPAPTPAASFQSMIGTAFATIFNASATSDPVDPTDASVPALAPASDPINDGV